MEHLAYHAGELGKAVMWNLGMGGDDATARNGEFALSPEHYAYEGYQAQKAEQSAAFLAGQEEVPGLLGAFNHTCLIPLNRSLVAGNGTLTWYDEQLDGPLGYGSCADSSAVRHVGYDTPPPWEDDLGSDADALSAEGAAPSGLLVVEPAQL